MNVNARMRIEINLNECEHFLKTNWISCMKSPLLPPLLDQVATIQ